MKKFPCDQIVSAGLFVLRVGLEKMSCFGTIKLWIAVAATGLLFTAAVAAQPTSATQLWQLLDYVAVDYGGAVNDGKIANASEYAEMLDFTENASKQARSLPDHAQKVALVGAVQELQAAVSRKAGREEVAGVAHRAKQLLISAFPIPVAPKKLPDLTRGARLYSAQCAVCHGATGAGDGQLARTLEPRPIAFTDGERASSRSLMALYQVISQGVEGTSMPGFAALSDDERWALAFYVGSLAYDEAARDRGEQLWSKDAALKSRFPDLEAVTTSTEAAAAESMPGPSARDVVAYLRSHPEAVQAVQPHGTRLARVRLEESLETLRAGDRVNATKLALSAYLDGFEPLEPLLSARDKSLLSAVEDAMLSYRFAVSKGSEAQAVSAATDLEKLLTQVEDQLNGAEAAPGSVFAGALTILLREGVEALLIIVSMVAFLKRTQRPDVLRYVHAGWISALVCGALTWVVATRLVAISGASREVTEGLGCIFAAAVLLSVGLWMHQKSSAGRWQAYLKEQMSAAMTRRSAWGLFALAFVAVYREVFETILFYSALAAHGNRGALLAGFFTALALLAAIAWVMLRTSARMPVGKFFSVTSILVAVLAVILTGKGVSALQEAGWVGVQPMGLPTVELLGLHPTAETLSAQVLVLLMALAGFGMNSLGSLKKSCSS